MRTRGRTALFARSRLESLALLASGAACAASPAPSREGAAFVESTPVTRAPTVPDAPLSRAPPSVAPETSAAPAAAPVVVIDAAGCVTNPSLHAAQRIVRHHAAEVEERLGRPPRLGDFETPSACFAVASLPDLDGDGLVETEVLESCSWGTAGALHMLYFSSRGCARFAGELVSAELSPLSTQAAGVADLEATWSNGCAGRDFTWSRYRWDGSAYRVVDEATCQLCDDAGAPTPPPRANKHAHCKAASKERGR